MNEPGLFRRTHFSLSPSLATVLVAGVVLPFVVVMSVAGWYSVRQLELYSQSRMQEDIELIARAIRLPLSHAMERGHDGTVRRALESAFRFDRVYGVYVYDEVGEEVYSSGSRSGRVSSGEAATLAKQKEEVAEFAQAGQEQVFSYFVPLVDRGQRVIGLLQLTRRGSEFDEYVDSVRQNSTRIIAVSGLVLGSIVLLAHGWGVGRPLWSFERSANRIKSGDTAHRLEKTGPRELQVLSSVINEMLETMEKSRADIAAKNVRERELLDRLHQSEKLAALGRLAAGVAHELGSPLAALDGRAQQLLRRKELTAEIQAPLKVIRNQVSRMEVIVRQLLDYGRSNPLDLSLVDVNQPLRTLAQEVEPNGGTVSVSIEIPEETSGHMIRVDRARLGQALSNLMRNGLHAAKSYLRVTSRIENNTVIYTFEDDGPGISEENLPRLFEPFFTTKRVGEGIGLGLAVSQAAAKDHDGAISACNRPGGGARFELTIPLAE